MFLRSGAALALSVITTNLPAALVPDTYKFALLPTLSGEQKDSGQGSVVAMEGTRVVLGAPRDATGGTSAGLVRVYDAVTGALLYKLTNPDPLNQTLFGNSVGISDSKVIVGVPWSDAATARGIAYLYDLNGATPTVPTLTFTNPLPYDYALFGSMVAISTNYVAMTVVSSDTNQGRVFVFDLTSPTPTVPLTVLTNPFPNFGFADRIAISGARIAVGAPTANFFRGAVYLYHLTNAIPSQPSLTLTNPLVFTNALNRFGDTLSLAGNRVIAGTLQNSSNCVVYVFNQTNNLQGTPLAITNPVPNDPNIFGTSVTAWGNFMAVGAKPRYHNSLSTNFSSLVHVYNLLAINPVMPALTLTNPGAAKKEFFGVALDGSGLRLTVGAPATFDGAFDNTNPPPVGGAYVFQLNAADPFTPLSVLNDVTPESHVEFGHAVALSGTRVAVGIPYDNSVNKDAGMVKIFDLSSATPTNAILSLTSPGTNTSGDNFGRYIALHQNWLAAISESRDGFTSECYLYHLSATNPTTPVFSVPADGIALAGGWNVSGSYQTWLATYSATPLPGSTYRISGAVYELTATNPAAVLAELTNSAVTTAAGATVAISGRRAVLGQAGATTNGLILVYDVPVTNPGGFLPPSLVISNPFAGTSSIYFDRTLALSGNNLFVLSTTLNTNSLSYFDLAGTNPAVPVFTFTPTNQTPAGYFGGSMTASGNRVLVSDFSGIGATRTRLFDMASATPTTAVMQVTNPIADFSQFGVAQALEGNIIAVGDYNSTAAGFSAGAVFIYAPATNTAELQAETLGDFFADGGTQIFPPQLQTARSNYVVTVRNTGIVPLVLFNPRITGGTTNEFSVSALRTNFLAANASTFLVVTSTPTGGLWRNSTLQVSNSVAAAKNFNLGLSLYSLSLTNDTDGDGLSDASEVLMNVFGFDWTISQTNLVNIYHGNANGAGYYTQSQLQALDVGAPLIARNAANGQFELTIGVNKSTNLATFAPMPLTTPQVGVDGQGKVRVQIADTNNIGFYRIYAQ
ncbi:MAG: hypothetical protein U1F65_09865 [Verrucomicrobiota bacterium]